MDIINYKFFVYSKGEVFCVPLPNNFGYPLQVRESTLTVIRNFPNTNEYKALMCLTPDDRPYFGLAFEHDGKLCPLMANEKRRFKESELIYNRHIEYQLYRKNGIEVETETVYSVIEKKKVQVIKS